MAGDHFKHWNKANTCFQVRCTMQIRKCNQLPSLQLKGHAEQALKQLRLHPSLYCKPTDAGATRLRFPTNRVIRVVNGGEARQLAVNIQPHLVGMKEQGNMAKIPSCNASKQHVHFA